MHIIMYQGEKNGRDLGYVSGADGGYFFTWSDTLSETLESVEVDERGGNGGLDRGAVVAFLESRLPATRRGSIMGRLTTPTHGKRKQ